MSILQTALFLVLVTERITEALAAPLRQKFPNLDLWWLIYVTWIIGGGLVFLAQVNLFSGVFPNELVGQILSAILAGGGANLLHDVFDR